MRSLALLALVSTTLSSVAHAQFDNAWVTFSKRQELLRTPAGTPAFTVSGDTRTKEMAWGDLDKDGWTDLVIVTMGGSNGGFVLMNRDGVLVDRTALDATDSNVPGDQGFMTPTANRDVVLADVNQDGWLDVITSGGYSQTQITPLTMPRVYMNKGASAGGPWLGLRFEYGRIPAYPGNLTYGLVGSLGSGDVTADGFPDLFVNTGSARDSLLVNDGTGNFIHSGTTRMTATMLQGTPWGTGVRIVDVNGDGWLDIARCHASAKLYTPFISIAYNDPANVGFFPQALWQQDVSGSLPWNLEFADLNQDGLLDLMFPEDAQDSVRYGTGYDASNRLQLGPVLHYQFVTGADDGFGGSLLTADLDGDGWKDVIQTDVDFESPGCSSRCHIYHNRPAGAGSQSTPIEEAGQASGAWRGIVGMLASDLTGTHDVAALDIDRDGDLDLVFGRCVGTFVWINERIHPVVTPVCVGDGTGGACPCGNFGSPRHGCANSLFPGGSHLTTTGFARVLDDTFTLQATNVSNSPGLYYQSTGTQLGGAGVPFGDGLLCGAGTIVRLGVAIASGNASSMPNTTMPTALHIAGQAGAGDLRHYQLWHRDGDPTYCSPGTFNLTNAISVTWTN